MILLVDIGNTRLKWAFTCAGGLVSGGGQFVHRAVPLSELLRAHFLEIDRPRRVLACNVGGTQMAEALSAWAAAAWHLQVEFAVSQAAGWGVRSAYLQPASLGVDRWVALVAARQDHPGPVCVVDCGTAITLDVLTAAGQHLGGLIVPGIALMRRSLSDHTSDIPRVEEHGVPELGCTTKDAVSSGCLQAAVAVIDRAVANAGTLLGCTVKCVLTGGDAPQVLGLLHAPVVFEPQLVLRGLAVMAGNDP